MSDKASPPPFGPVLRRILEAREITPGQLAAALGVSQQRVTNLLSANRDVGRTNPSWSTIQSIADALGISTDELRTIPPPKKIRKNKPNGVDKRNRTV